MREGLPTPRHLYLGYLAALGAAMGYGAGAVVGRKAVLDFAPPMVATSLSLLFGAAMIAVLFHRSAFKGLGLIPARGWMEASMAGLCGGLGVASMFFALERSPVVLMAPLTGTYPLFAILLTHVFLQRLDRVTWHTLIGGALVVVGVTLVAAGRG